MLGSSVGVGIFTLLKSLGQIDLVIAIAYVITLSGIGIMMAVESSVRSRALAPLAWHRPSSISIIGRKACPSRCASASRASISSALLPAGIGFIVGIMSAIMGVGGAFLLVPAMIYLLGMATGAVIGTSLFQIIFVQAWVTFWQANTNQTVDVLLALILTIGGVVGAQMGGRLGCQAAGRTAPLPGGHRHPDHGGRPALSIGGASGGTLHHRHCRGRALSAPPALIAAGAAVAGGRCVRPLRRRRSSPISTIISSPSPPGFAGADVLLFGTTDGPGDVVVVVKGPVADVDVLRKERVGGIWINRKGLGFQNVPAVYMHGKRRSRSPDLLPRRPARLLPDGHRERAHGAGLAAMIPI